MNNFTIPFNVGTVIDFLRYERDPWGIKDLDSKYVYVNNMTHLGIDLNFNIEGLSDNEVPHPVADVPEITSSLVVHDSNVIRRMQKQAVVQTNFHIKRKEHVSYLFEKRPFYDAEGKLFGTIYHGREFRPVSTLHLTGNFEASVCRFSPPNDIFTQKECLLIYWLMQRLSRKEIAAKMHISHRTVENRISEMYSKVNVSNNTSFIDYCTAAGFTHYVPYELVVSRNLLYTE